MTAKLYTDGSLNLEKMCAGISYLLVLEEVGQCVSRSKWAQGSVVGHANIGAIEALALVKALQHMKANGAKVSKLTWYCDSATAIGYMTHSKTHIIQALLDQVTGEFEACKVKGHVHREAATPDEMRNRDCDRRARVAREEMQAVLKRKADESKRSARQQRKKAWDLFGLKARQKAAGR